MPSEIVKQPNGLYARFSTIVDHFTYINMTEDEAYDLCLDEMGRRDAKEKVQRASDNCAHLSHCISEEPLARWKAALRTILATHGQEEYDKIVELDKNPNSATGE